MYAHRFMLSPLAILNSARATATGSRYPTIEGACGPPRTGGPRDGSLIFGETRLPAGIGRRVALVAGVICAMLLASASVARAHAAFTSAAGTPSATGRDRGGLAAVPHAAQAVVSRTLGRYDTRYGVALSRGALLAGNPAQHFDARFTSAGARIESGPGWFDLSLWGYGYGGTVHRVAAARPAAGANLVAYRYARLREWWANGPLGLEQGFTVQGPPSGTSPGRLTLALALSGDLRGSLTRGGGAIALSGSGASLTYGHLAVTDARGRVLPAHFALRGRIVSIVADVAGASYPVRIDPLVQQAKLVPSDAGLDQFGYSVAISGTTLVAGAILASVNGNMWQGAVYVFTERGSSWTQQAKLTAADGAANDQLGGSVAVSGSTVVAGAIGADGGNGAAYVFAQNATGWTQQAKLTAPDGAPGDELGSSVAIAGGAVVAGAPYATVNGNTQQGAAYVFAQGGLGWTQEAKLTAPDGAADGGFGYSLAIAGGTVVAGAPGATVDGNEGQGAAYVFTQSATGWTQQAELTAAGGASLESMGFSVALSGNTIVAGAPTAVVDGNPYQGAAYVFTGSGTGWTQQAKLTAADGAAFDQFGWSVGVSGSTIVAAATDATVNGNPQQGAVYEFTQSGSSWTQKAKLTAADGATPDELGGSLAISGGTVVAGIDRIVDTTGAVYVFGPTADTTTTSVSCTAGTVTVGHATSCTATVTDTAANPTTPTGTVTFNESGSGAGSFAGGGSCALSGSGAAASCSVTYSPSAAGTHTITASYEGDQGFTASQGDVTTIAEPPNVIPQPVSGPPSAATGSPVTYTVLPASNHFTVSKVKIQRDGTITFAVRVPGPGRLNVLETAWRGELAASPLRLSRAAGRFVFARAHTTTDRAATVQLKVVPDTLGRRSLAHDPRRLTLELSVSYTPIGGAVHVRRFRGLHVLAPGADSRRSQ